MTTIRSVKNDPDTIAAGSNKKIPENIFIGINFVIKLIGCGGRI